MAAASSLVPTSTTVCRKYPSARLLFSHLLKRQRSTIIKAAAPTAPSAAGAAGTAGQSAGEPAGSSQHARAYGRSRDYPGRLAGELGAHPGPVQASHLNHRERRNDSREPHGYRLVRAQATLEEHRKPPGQRDRGEITEEELLAQGPFGSSRRGHLGPDPGRRWIDASCGLSEARPAPRPADSGCPRSDPEMLDLLLKPRVPPNRRPLQVRSPAFVLVDTTFIRITGGPYLIHMDSFWGTVFGRVGSLSSALAHHGHKCPLGGHKSPPATATTISNFRVTAGPLRRGDPPGQAGRGRGRQPRHRRDLLLGPECTPGTVAATSVTSERAEARPPCASTTMSIGLSP